MSYDVLIVGGGVMGSATAYHLMTADPSLAVGVIEKDSSYQRASTVLSDGNVRIQFNLAENVRISQYTMEVLDTFADDMATPTYRPEVGARHQGNLFMVDESCEAAAHAGLELQRSLGCDVEWLDMEAVAASYPPLSSELLLGGTLGRRDGSVDPSAVLRGFRNKAIELGAVYIDDEVTSLEVAHDRAAGATLRSGGGRPLRGRGQRRRRLGPGLPLRDRSRDPGDAGDAHGLCGLDHGADSRSAQCLSALWPVCDTRGGGDMANGMVTANRSSRVRLPPRQPRPFHGSDVAGVGELSAGLRQSPRSNAPGRVSTT